MVYPTHQLDCKNRAFRFGPHHIELPFPAQVTLGGVAPSRDHIRSVAFACPLCQHVYEYDGAELRHRVLQAESGELPAIPVPVRVRIRCEQPGSLGPPPAECANLVSQGVHVEGSLTYNTYLQQYMMVGATIMWDTEPHQCGIAYTLSPDLIHWSRVQIMLAGNVTFTPAACYGFPAIAYGAVIDHNDTSPNFENAGQDFYLYYTRFNDPYLNRDLVRVHVTMAAN